VSLDACARLVALLYGLSDARLVLRDVAECRALQQYVSSSGGDLFDANIVPVVVGLRGKRVPPQAWASMVRFRFPTHILVSFVGSSSRHLCLQCRRSVQGQCGCGTLRLPLRFVPAWCSGVFAALVAAVAASSRGNKQSTIGSAMKLPTAICESITILTLCVHLFRLTFA
jgi:hypothetical protein